MEDALAQVSKNTLGIKRLGLNPCFNGRCTRTEPEKVSATISPIGLNPCFNGRCTRT